MVFKKFLCFLILIPFRLRYKIKVIKRTPLPKEGGVLLLGNHISWIDWAILQASFNRCIRFVMNRDLYNLPFYKPFLKFFGVIPISSKSAKESLKAVREALRSGEVVCIFPEGTISYTGNLNSFKKGFEIALRGLDDVKVMAFYIKGIWGSVFSRAQNKKKEILRREITIVYEESRKIDVFSLKCQISKLSSFAYVRGKRDLKEFESERIFEILNISKGDGVLSSYQSEPILDKKFSKNIAFYKDACKEIAKRNIAYLFADSYFVKSVLNDSLIHPLYLDSLKYIFVFEKIDRDVVEAFEKKFRKKIYLGYRFRDVLVTLNLPDVMETAYFRVQIASKEGSFGKPISGAGVSVRKKGKELTFGETGEIWVRSYEYDWVWSGDFGYLDRECFLYIK